MVTYACMRRNWGFDCFWFLRRTEKYKKNEPYKKYYFYWNACTKPGKCVVMYLCVKGIHFASFYNFYIWFGNCFDGVVYLSFYSSIYTIILWCPCYMPTYVPRVEGIMHGPSAYSMDNIILLLLLLWMSLVS